MALLVVAAAAAVVAAVAVAAAVEVEVVEVQHSKCWGIPASMASTGGSSTLPPPSRGCLPPVPLLTTMQLLPTPWSALLTLGI